MDPFCNRMKKVISLRGMVFNVRANTELIKDDLVDFYREMRLSRTYEEKAIEYFKKGKVIGNMHMCIGEEAVAVGVIKSLTKDDYVAPAHRCDGDFIAKGANIKAMMAELMGKEEGICGGRAGKMHQSAPEVGILTANGIVGGAIALGAGHALYASMFAPERVSVSFFGDGGANQGSFHECVNQAAVWKLPVIFVCENNGYAISTSFESATSCRTVAQRSAAYDIPGVRVDGNDVIAVYEAAKEAVNRARSGNGPSLIECVTYRFRGHHEGDEQTYRRKEEVENQIMNNDPIKRLADYLAEEYGWTDEERSAIDSSVEQEIQEAVEYALGGTPVNVDNMMDHLFAPNNN